MVLTDVYKYFRTAFVNVARLTFMAVVHPKTLAHTALATFGKMINRRVRNGISITRGQCERLYSSICYIFLRDISSQILCLEWTIEPVSMITLVSLVEWPFIHRGSIDFRLAALCGIMFGGYRDNLGAGPSRSRRSKRETRRSGQLLSNYNVFCNGRDRRASYRGAWRQLFAIRA